MIEDCIGSIYDAALSPEHWDGAVQQIGATFGAKVLLLHGGLRCLDDGGGAWSHGIDPATYNGPQELRTPEHNPGLRVALAAPVGHIFDRREFITDDGMDRHPVARDFFRPNGMFHLMASPVQKDAESVSLFFVARPREGHAFEGREPDALAALANHVGRAMRTHRALRLAEARGVAFAQALERLRHGVILADAALRVLHANRAAEVMLDAGEGLARRLGRLTLGDLRAQAALEAAARRLAGPRPELGETRIALPRPDGRPSRVVTVLPALGDGPSAIAPRAQLLILVADPEGGAAPDAAALARAFGLTAAEGRVAVLAAAGTGVDAIAARLGVSGNTVKAQLKAVYLKTGAANRAELLRLALAAAATP
jgi:DNA-binding CsgD family transcriptional regulator/PAS domain-containing protein